MKLKSGQHLLHFRLIEKIGEGGMGVVWKALDTTLEREVAIKILPEEFIEDTERLGRFEREAKLLASLNHPNIATIHGLHQTGAVRFLAMELIAGQDLVERMKVGPMEQAEAFAVACQVAEGLEAAHESGVVHRDLKPANVKVTPEGAVKVLDFGLAKAFANEPAKISDNVSQSPTRTTSATRAGVILGTAAYMSPEQARGMPVDKRTDIWAFGCVLYEMLTGRMTFGGETASDCIARILEREPNWTVLPPRTPKAARELLRRCLEKNALNRLRDIGDARIILTELQAGQVEQLASEGASNSRTSGGRRWSWLLSGLVLGSVVAGLAIWYFLQPAEEVQLPVRRSKISVPGLSADWITRPLISPNGRRVVYAAEDHLWIHELDGLEPRRLENTENARAPFWSYDGESLAFGRDGELWRIEVDGGGPRLLCEIPGSSSLYDGDWNEHGVIVFAVNSGPIYEVSAQGGEPRVRIELDADSEIDFHSVRFLPDGETLLAQPHLIEKGLGIESKALLVLRADGTRKVALSDESWSAILHGEFASGHIIYERRRGQRGIWAVPFSLDRLETTGDPFPIVRRGRYASASADGTLVYVPDDGSEDNVQPALVDRSGKVIKSFGKPRRMLPIFSISPDGRQAVFTVGETEKGEGDLWVFDFDRDTARPLTKDPGLESMPNWSPGGRRIAFVSGVNPVDFMLQIIDVENPDGAENLGKGFRPVFSPDGLYLTYSTFEPPNETKLWYRSMGPDAEPVEFHAIEGKQVGGRISPGGRWIAYTGLGLSATEVFIRGFPDGENRQQASTEGGKAPCWGPGGDELFYMKGQDVMVLSVKVGASLDLGQPRKLFTRERAPVVTPDGWNQQWFSNLEVTPDGGQFLVLQPSGIIDEGRPDEIVVVQNWLVGSSRR